MSSPALPPPLPPADFPPPNAPPSGQWSHAADTSEPQKGSKPWGWIVLGGCLVAVIGTGLVATILVPLVLRKFTRAQVTKVRVDLHDLHGALDVYATTHGSQYPDSLEALVRPDKDGHTILRDERKLPRDPWGHEYVYTPPSAERATFTLCSYGRGGEPGGEGEDADIYENEQQAEDR